MKDRTFECRGLKEEIESLQQMLRENTLKFLEQSKGRFVRVTLQVPGEKEKTVMGVLGDNWMDSTPRELGVDRVFTLKKRGTQMIVETFAVRHVLEIEVQSPGRSK